MACEGKQFALRWLAVWVAMEQKTTENEPKPKLKNSPPLSPLLVPCQGLRQPIRGLVFKICVYEKSPPWEDRKNEETTRGNTKRNLRFITNGTERAFLRDSEQI